MFPTTRWTLILASREGDEARRAALESLLATYWKPIYFYLRRRGLAVEAAEDVVQGFCLHLLERDFLPRLDPARGRFRSYLLTALDHYLANVRERESAQKRGGGVRLVPIDLAMAERELEAAPAEAATAYEREWAMGVMERALGRLREDYAAGRRQGPASVFLRFFSFEPAPSYADAAAAAGLTVPQFKAALHRARQRFRELLREEVAGTLQDESEADGEIGDLLRALTA
jgi:DNA-directed RNA polymerase specialized sigma24 family protein